MIALGNKDDEATAKRFLTGWKTMKLQWCSVVAPAKSSLMGKYSKTLVSGLESGMAIQVPFMHLSTVKSLSNA